MTPAVSIVIRAFNEERYIGRLLDLIAGQTIRDPEIIVVDSGSFDRTREVVAGRVRLVRIEPADFTFGYSLNVGIRAATAPLAAIVSAHTEPTDEHWLESLVRPFDDEDVAMVYGRQIGDARSKFSERLDFVRTFGGSPRRMSAADAFANNANAAVRRTLWETYAFDERLPGLEDIAWARHWIAHGRAVVYEPAAAIRHIHQESWPQVRHRYHREAVAAKQIGVKGSASAFLEPWVAAARTASDLASALREGCLGARAGEIVRFRLEKARGTMSGLLNGKATASDKESLDYFDKECRAVVIHAPNRASLDARRLAPPTPRDVVIRVAYTGVCGTDLEILRGTLGYFKSGLSSFPLTPGHEFSGWIARAGARVEHVREGDPVVVECIQSCGECAECRRENWIGCAERTEVGVMRRDGAYADFISVPGRFVHKLPEGTDMKRAAICEPLAVALKGVKRLARVLSPESRCAVVGGGPIGYLSAQVLRHRGHPVTVFDRDPGRRAIAEGIGMAATGDLDALRDADAIVEATGDPQALDAILSHSAAGVAILLLGLPYARVESGFEKIVAFDKIVIGSVGSGAAEFREAIALLPQLELGPLTSAVMPLERFADAWESFTRREHLKILLQPGG